MEWIEIDEILDNYLLEAHVMWEGWPPITAEDLADYQGRNSSERV